MAQEHASALKEMALCRTLSGAELEAIAAIVETREVAAGGELFREGDLGDGLYLVVTGEIEVVKRGPAGEHSLAKLGPGGVLGEMSLITSEARSATGRARAQTKALYLPVLKVRVLLDSGSTPALKIVAAIAEVLARRLATMNGLVLELSGRAGPSAAARSPDATQNLRDLHRKMQVWSF
jgi:CRP/FNR family cyclic AMP-dependent transcriptional regulator